MKSGIAYKELRNARLKDREYANTYLSVAFDEAQKENDFSIFLKAVRNIIEARGTSSYSLSFVTIQGTKHIDLSHRMKDMKKPLTGAKAAAIINRKPKKKLAKQHVK